MKKSVVLVVLVVSLFAFATAAFASVANTKHNLTSSGGMVTRTSSGEATLCGFCHLPHGGSTAVAQLPLWAKKIPAAPAYTVYGGGNTLSFTPVGQPGTFSLTCLSCHDGTVGLGTVTKNGVDRIFPMQSNVGWLTNNAFNNTAIEATNGYSPYIGTDLQNDHPVGFEYPAAGYAGGIPGISAAVDPVAGFLKGNYPVFTYTSPARTNVFECATCHDPHLEDNPAGTQTKFLRTLNAGICQDCHDVK